MHHEAMREAIAELVSEPLQLTRVVTHWPLAQLHFERDHGATDLDDGIDLPLGGR